MKCTIFLLILLFSCSISMSQESQPKLPAKFKGTLIDVAGVIPGSPTPPFNMNIEKYTSDEDVQRFAQILTQKGPEGLAREIHELKNGKFSVGSSFPYHLGITRTFVRDGNSVIRALTDRPIKMFKVVETSDNRDYPFGFIEIVLNSEGKGTGNLVAACNVEIKNGSLQILTLGLDPIKITNVTAK